MKKTLFLCLLFSVFLISDVLAQLYYNIPSISNVPVVRKNSLTITVGDKETGGNLKPEDVEIYVHTKRGKILLTAPPHRPIALYTFWNKENQRQEVVEDTMVFEVNARGYRGGKFFFLHFSTFKTR